MSLDWKHWQVGPFESWTVEWPAAMNTLAAEVWLDHGEWNWTVYCGRCDYPGGSAPSADEAKQQVQERFSKMVQ